MIWTEEMLKRALRPTREEREVTDARLEGLCGLNPTAVGALLGDAGGQTVIAKVYVDENGNLTATKIDPQDFYASGTD